MSLIRALRQVLAGLSLGSRDRLPDLRHRRGFCRRHRGLGARVHHWPGDGPTMRVTGGLGARHYWGTTLLVFSFWTLNISELMLSRGQDLSIIIKVCPVPCSEATDILLAVSWLTSRAPRASARLFRISAITFWKIRTLYKMFSTRRKQNTDLMCLGEVSVFRGSAFLKLFWGWAAGAGSWRLSSKIHQIKQEIFMLIICLKHWLECVRWWQRSSWLAMWVQPALGIGRNNLRRFYNLVYHTNVKRSPKMHYLEGCWPDRPGYFSSITRLCK